MGSRSRDGEKSTRNRGCRNVTEEKVFSGDPHFPTVTRRWRSCDVHENRKGETFKEYVKKGRFSVYRLNLYLELHFNPVILFLLVLGPWLSSS